MRQKNKEKKFRAGVFGVTYYLDHNTPHYLLLKRKLHWKGWEFPKGGVEKFETKRHALKRELREETGLDLIKTKKHDYSGRYFYAKVFPDRPGFIGQTFSLYSAEVREGKVKFDKNEHAGYKWVSYKDALKLLKYPDQKKALEIVNQWVRNNFS